ncbi:hypothetical protein [Streptomyces sp. DSM 40484]|uniref:hypothetical protein n=1 Tax=Streptomyces kroppenstedtii TaxID=3051181 RepID=UPI0028D8D973|nr:hypothetical protein [Streptomyces sp. DSM 40484]
MTRIKVLEAIAGADFAWSPGDLVDLPDKEAAVWADGHRAVLADDQDQGEPAPSVVHQQPVVVDEDGQALEVIEATVEDEGPAEDEDGPRLVRWTVTVRLPSPAARPEAEPDSGPGEHEQTEGETAEDETGDPPVALFDPREHSNRQVLAYLDTVGEQEALRVLNVEATEGEDRAGIRKNRDAVLEAARQRRPAPRRDTGAEVAADASRGGGRGGQPETRDW